MKLILFSTLLLFPFLLFSQAVEERIVVTQISENEIQLLSIDTLLTPIAGAPDPYYSYWWEFGDGSYSRAKSPTHLYSQQGDFGILLARTNNYDDGKGRPIKKKDINITRGAMASTSEDDALMFENENLEINKNQDPKPNEQIVFAQSYKNNSQQVQMGTILFFYNESTFENKHFELQDSRNHFNEININANKSTIARKIDSLIIENGMSLNNQYFNDLIIGSGNVEYNLSLLNEEEQTEIQNFRNRSFLKKEVQKAFDTYTNVVAWNFSDLNPREERNIFLTLQATSEMLTDTNVTISVESFFIPNNMQFATKVKENMPVVTAHDPNKLIVNKSKTFNAFSKKNDLTYEIKFQNVGKGPAEEVKLRFYNNAEIDITKINIIDFEPKCEICSENCKGSYIDTTITKDYVEFYFHNIYLPGTRQTDLESRKASKGFVKFSLNTKKRIKQNNLTCRTEIYFDKEEPIRTNNAKTRFQKKAYFGLETGIGYLPLSFSRLDVFLRGTFTYRISNSWYYRAELGAKYIPYSLLSENSISDTTYKSVGFSAFEYIDPYGEFHDFDSTTVNYISKITKIDEQIRKQSIQLEFVPLELRKDINKFLSIGFGIQAKVNLVSFYNKKHITKIEEFKVAITTDTIVTPIYVSSLQQPSHYEVDFVVDKPRISLINDLSSLSNTSIDSKIYNFDFSSGLFFDINLGKINSIPYVGFRGNVDYNFSYQTIRPALQLYVGANF